MKLQAVGLPSKARIRSVGNDATAGERPRRSRAILAAHPELHALLGPSRATAVWIAAVFTLQLSAAALLSTAPWWIIGATAYCFGAFASLGIWTLLHECTHDLVFRQTSANRWAGIVCGLPLVLPCAAAFRRYHMLHHRHTGDAVLDGDVASDWEVRLVGHSAWRKAVWLLGAPLLQSLRPRRMKQVAFIDRWVAINFAVQISFNALVVATLGWAALCYLLLSNLFCLGLHPLGARWIQEHFEFAPGQDTYSYYGPFNRMVFNAGYHSEHHDIPRIAWHKLPQLRAQAPEFYEGLYAHRSWTVLLLRFIFDPALTPAKQMGPHLDRDRAE